MGREASSANSPHTSSRRFFGSTSMRGTGSPPTPAWSARSARSPGLRLRPLYSWRLLCGLRSKTHSCPEISGDPYEQPAADPAQSIAPRPDVKILLGLRPAAVDDEIGMHPKLGGC